MNDLQKLIEQLERQGNDAELLGLLACDPDTRAHSQRLADEYRALANSLRRQSHAIAA